MDHHFRLPFLDEALAGLQSAVEARMSAALIAPAGTGKTALLRRLRDALPEARYHVHYVKVTGLLAHACDQIVQRLNGYRRRVLAHLARERRAWPF